MRTPAVLLAAIAALLAPLAALANQPPPGAPGGPAPAPAAAPPAPAPVAALPPAPAAPPLPASPPPAALPAAGDAAGPRAERVSLAAAVQRALARNPSAAVAVEEVRRAEAIVREVRAGWFPTLTGTGMYTRLDADRLLNGSVVSAANQFSANLTLAVPIVVPQRWAQWSHAKDAVEVSKLGDADVRRVVAVAVARAYLTVIAQRRVAELSVRARDTARAHYDFSHTRLMGGIGNRIDAVRAEQQVLSDEAQLQVAAAGVVRAQEALGVLLGQDQPVDATDDPQLPAPPPLADALDEAGSRRPDVHAQEARIRAAQHVVRDDWTDYAPYLVGVFQPFYQNPKTLTLPTTGWQAQLILTLPFYDGGLRYGLAQERDATLAEAKLGLEGTLRQARSDVRVAFEAVRRSDDALRAARGAAQLAEQALELANLAYRAGATTNLEVIDAERVARDAETSAAVAEDNARQARVDLLGASGRFP